jgi:hypothetical protein
MKSKFLITTIAAVSLIAVSTGVVWASQSNWFHAKEPGVVKETCDPQKN